MFLGRSEELEELEYRYKTDRFEFGIIYGTRRIGKTSLLSEFVKGKKNIFFQAKTVNDNGNLISLSKQIASTFNLPESLTFRTFEDALEFIFEKGKEEKLIFIIDEYPYLTGGISSYLQEFIDHYKDESKLKLILAGSNISFMKEKLLSKNSPLYQRHTFKMPMKELDYEERVLFVDGIKDDEKIKYLALFGGYPYYLAMIDKSLSFEENVYNLLYSKYGNLQDAPDNIMSSTIRNKSVYNSILLSIAKRKNTINEIALYINEKDAKVSKYLNKLMESEIVEKRNVFNGNKKTTYYAISDPLIRFWFLFIFDNKDYISNGFGKRIYSEHSNQIKSFIAHSFEDVAIAYMTMLNRKGLLSYPYGLIKNYRADNSKLNRSIEIDGLSSYKSNLLVIECKYQEKEFDIAMYGHLKESVSIFDKYKNIEYYLFSKGGFSDSLKAISNKNIHLISIDDMFKNVA